MKVEIKVVDKKGDGVCGAGHEVGDVFFIDRDWKTPAGMCCSAFMVVWPNARVLLATGDKKYEGTVCCADAEVMMEFDLKLID